MDLRQLGALVAVADHRSFSAAARALHTVQSNISTHVARLERELGVTLVDRATGKLTPEGENWVTEEHLREWAHHPDAVAVYAELRQDGSVTPGLNYYRANIPPSDFRFCMKAAPRIRPAAIVDVRGA